MGNNGTMGFQNVTVTLQENLTSTKINDSSFDSFYATIWFYLDGMLLTMIAIPGMFGKPLLNLVLVPIRCNSMDQYDVCL